MNANEKGWRIFLLVMLLYIGYVLVAHGQPVPSRALRAQNVVCILRVSASRLYIRELTGNNDGVEVEAAQRAAGAKKGDAWCGCEQFMVQRLCGLPTPPWAAAARNWSPPNSPRTYFLRGTRGISDSIRVGDIVTFYYANLGRIGHVGRVVSLGRSLLPGRPPRSVIVRAGNTGHGGGREGAGVYDVPYVITSIYGAAKWNY